MKSLRFLSCALICIVLLAAYGFEGRIEKSLMQSIEDGSLISRFKPSPGTDLSRGEPGSIALKHRIDGQYEHATAQARLPTNETDAGKTLLVGVSVSRLDAVDINTVVSVSFLGDTTDFETGGIKSNFVSQVPAVDKPYWHVLTVLVPDASRQMVISVGTAPTKITEASNGEVLELQVRGVIVREATTDSVLLTKEED